MINLNEAIFTKVQQMVTKNQLTAIATDFNRPWGGFFVIDEKDAEKFIQLYFPHLTKEQLTISGKLSPKILMVAPNKRLSWQYHHRRAEIWKLIEGKAKVALSDNDEETEIIELSVGDIVQLSQGKRHRLIGDEKEWGIVAEIWQHTDSENPSNEDDIVRLQDDFGR